MMAAPGTIVKSERIEYDEQDFANAEYLWLMPDITASSKQPVFFTRTGSDRLFVLKSELPSRLGIFGLICMMCSDRVHTSLRSQDFIGLQSRKVCCVNSFEHARELGDAECEENWWVLLGDRYLPPFSKSLMKFNIKVRPKRLDLSDLCEVDRSTQDFGPMSSFGIRERGEVYLGMQLAYAASELEPLKPFDVAMTYERFGGQGDFARHLIVSNRFYTYCKSKKYKMNCSPVRVDPW